MNAASYNIWVKGTQVTDANKNDILNDGKGKVKYDSSNNILSFDNVSINSNTSGTDQKTGSCLYTLKALTICIKGDVTLTSYSSYSAVYIMGGFNVTFSTYSGNETDANLKIKASEDALTYGGTGTLQFRMMNVNIESGDKAIKSDTGLALKLYNCDFSVTGGTESSPIYGPKSIETEGTSITNSELTYDTSAHFFRKNGSQYKGKISWEATKYGIQVAGKDVTIRNKSYILGDKDASVTFDPNANLLTLKKATIVGGSNFGISATDDLNIALEGNSKITSSSNNGIYTKGNLTITGDGPYSSCLDVITTSNVCANIMGKNVTIKNCAMNLNSKRVCISGLSSANLVLEKALLDMTASYFVLDNIKSITYTGCYLSKPTNAYFKSSLKGLTTDGSSNKVTAAETLIGTDNVAPTVVNKNISVSNITDYSCTVSWNPATDNVTTQDKLTYQVEYKLSDESGWLLPNVGNVTTYIITGLKPGKTYQLDICVHDEVGKYNRYGEITFTTTTTSYGIKVAGVDVTSGNNTDVLGNGKVSYNNSTQTLTLNNATISATGSDEAILTVADLTINLIGTNNLTTTSSSVIKSQRGTMGKLLITSSNGNGVLNATSSANLALYPNACPLTIENCTVNAKGSSYGISGEKSVSPLIIKNATVTAEGASGSIKNFKSITLNGVEIASPTGAKISDGKVVDANGNLVTTKVTIKNVTYGLEIAGTKVTTANKDNIPVSSGSAKFDSETSTLTLTNATISPTSAEQGIYSEIPLTINLVGTSKIKTTGNYGIECSKDLTIQSTSDGKLTVNTNSYGIAGRANTTIKNCGVSITADGTNSIGLYGYNTGKVTIDNANVDINANGGAIKQVASLTTNKTGIVTPTKGKYSSSSKSVVDANGNVATSVKIETEVYYNFSLNGIRVSNLTAADIEGDGSAVYDRATRTLTLDDFVINDCDITGISIEEDMNIVIKGKSSVNIIEAGNALYIENCKVTISGGAELYLGSDDDAAIELSNATLTLNSANVSASSKTTYAIKDKSLNSSLIVNSSKVTLNSKVAAAYIKSATLNDCFVDTPDNGYFAAAKNMFTDENGNVAEDVTILAGEATDKTAPVLPSDATITVTNITDTSAAITWTTATDNKSTVFAITYEVNFRKSSESTYTVAGTIKGGCQYSLAGLDEDTEYIVTVYAIDEAGNRSEGYDFAKFKTEKAPDTTAPTLPTDATINVTETTPTSITISWNAPTDDRTPADKMYYQISYYILGEMSPTTVYATGVNEYTITGLEAESKYNIALTASDEAGNRVSYGDVIASTTAVPDVTKPNLPTDATITATEVTKTSIAISWNAASDDKTDAADLNYEVLIQKDGAWTTLTNLTGVTEYKIEGLEDMTEYKIAVYVSDDSGNEAAYDVLTISTAVGIDAILAENPDVKMYNTAGVLVGKNYRGVVVINGKKYMKTK